ncbi:MFS transporter [Nonomuraea antimicrobica]
MGAAFLIAAPVAVVVLALAPVLLPEYAAPGQGRLDPVSVVLSLVAVLPLVYAIKSGATHGVDALTPVLVVVSAVAGTVFVRRQLRLAAPLLDMTLFRDRAFSAALTVLLVGLVGVGGTMYLVTQFLQLVEGLSPAIAGLWMGLPALAMFVAAIGAPIVARRIRPGTVMGATLGVSLIGYGLLATAEVGDATNVVLGFGFVYLGLGAIAALGTDIVVGAAPAEKSGSAAALSETVQEFGIAAGVALLGSLSTAVYRSLAQAPAGVTPEVAERITASLDGALAADRADTVQQAREAFVVGLNVASLAVGAAILAVTVLGLFMLRHIRPIGETRP